MGNAKIEELVSVGYLKKKKVKMLVNHVIRE